MEFDPLLLSRIQFGLTVTFHIIFPTISIGLAMFLTVFEGLWLWTRMNSTGGSIASGWLFLPWASALG
ncbi:hypothetical protein DK871_06070 [Pseudomonas sp. L13]|nr:hypothetical protein [Pseudomonas sp. L13]